MVLYRDDQKGVVTVFTLFYLYIGKNPYSVPPEPTAKRGHTGSSNDGRSSGSVINDITCTPFRYIGML